MTDPSGRAWPVSVPPGQLKTTFSGSGYQSASYTSEVRIGEGVDLSAGPRRKASAAPGGAFTAPLDLHNAGSTAANGAVAVFFADYAIRAGQRHSNCTYDEDQLTSCSFASTFAAGAGYTAPVGYRLGADTYAPGGAYAQIIWMTPADFKDYQGYLGRMGLSVGSPGTGDTLTLTRSGAARAAAVPQTDINDENDWSSLQVTVTGRQGADLAAIGDTASGITGLGLPAAPTPHSGQHTAHPRLPPEPHPDPAAITDELRARTGWTCAW